MTIERVSRVEDDLREMKADMKEGFLRMDTQYQRLESKMDTQHQQMESKMDTQFQRLESRIERMESRMDTQFRWTLGVSMTMWTVIMAAIITSVVTVLTSFAR